MRRCLAAAVFSICGFFAVFDPATVVRAAASGDTPAAEAAPAPGGPAPDYRKQIQPLLVKYCARCHGAEKTKADLRLDTAAGLRRGGNSGAAIVPGKPEESLLIKALTGADDVSPMPPDGDGPSEAEIDLLKRWIAAGAPAPDENEARPRRTSSHWAFQPVRRPEVPEVGRPDWVVNPIDAFILQKLEQHGLEPSPEAPREVLLRRVSFDLIGLPPTPEELHEFLADDSPDAYERAVERLLRSPHYGERWARDWLDLARYADSNGFTRDQPRSIWPYRDWVISAFNRNLPFDQFVVEQIAGDMLPQAGPEQLVATGFHRNTLINEEGGTDPEQFRVEAVVDRVGTTGSVFLGLTIGCAQCHDHKYDPVSQREFYQLFAFLNNCDEPRHEVPTEEQLRAGEPERRDRIRAQIQELERQFQARDEEFRADVAAWEKTVTEEQRGKLPIPVANTLNLSLVMRTDENWKALFDYYKALPEARAKYQELEQIAQLKAQEPVFVTTLILRERKQPRATHVHVRGDFLRPGALVTPDVPEVLPPLRSAGERPNRLDFARWLVDPAQPLTPRVTMNRLWQRYFGRGLVETENDFGTQGTPPSHPELLDWLASEFVASGWDLRQMHRLIVTSSTYRRSSAARPDAQRVDPHNRLLARQNRLRLPAELVRDAGLAVSGLLCRAVGGPSVYPPQPEGVFDFTQDKKPWIAATDGNRYRRGMYTYLWRSSPYPAMTVFDFPDANVACTRRNRSNTPLQSLTLANDAAFVEFAQAMAARVLQEGGRDDAQRLRFAFRAALAREPSPQEESRLAAYLAEQRLGLAGDESAARSIAGTHAPADRDPAECAAWTLACRVLLNLDEFITRE